MTTEVVMEANDEVVRPCNRRSYRDATAAMAEIAPDELLVVVTSGDGCIFYEVTALGDHGVKQREACPNASDPLWADPATGLALTTLAAVAAARLFPLVEFVGTYSPAGTQIINPIGLAKFVDSHGAVLGF